jgi:hypothetical protein
MSIDKTQLITLYIDMYPTDNYEEAPYTLQQTNPWNEPVVPKDCKRYRVQFEVPKHQREQQDASEVTVTAV